jgi:glucan biosynthesis protein C
MSTHRSHAMDHLRIVLTLLVILHHTAIVYGGSGGWYWREQPNGSQPLLLFFNATNQSHFMGFFFLLAGYFTPSSLDRKGAGRFIQDRLLSFVIGASLRRLPGSGRVL